MKVFILDDDRINNDLNIAILKLAGITDVDVRITCKGGLLYLEECKKNKVFPDLMFVDLNMPGMSGFGFIKEYEKSYRKHSPKTSIIMLTNSILNEHRLEAKKYVSVVDYYIKPLTLCKLVDAVRKMNVDA